MINDIAGWQIIDECPETPLDKIFPISRRAACLIARNQTKAPLLSTNFLNIQGDRAQNHFEETKAKAEKGDAAAQMNLGTCYFDGSSVAKDVVEAVEWFRKAAEQNFAEAQYHLAICYSVGEGVEKNDAESFKWLRRAAVQNNRKAQYGVALCYSNGEGVKEDNLEAVKWHRKAAEQGYPTAQYQLGRRYYFGDGVLVDYAEAVKWNVTGPLRVDWLQS